MRFPTFEQALSTTRDVMRRAPVVRTERWQGLDISKKPEMATHEIVQWYFNVPVPTADLDSLRSLLKPSLPWADQHFEERVSGQPLNPPPSWRAWPWGHSAGNFLDQSGQFNHTYPERFWPKKAGNAIWDETAVLHGIRYAYGDLGDMLDLLEREPNTRQAYLPVWFPEDTGVVHKDRAPCTLGYHFLRRDGKLHVSYYIRSCDYTRHFLDDIYLTVRLQLWVIQQLVKRNATNWLGVQPGNFAMHIGSLHMFRNDWLKEFGS